ncbi:hypothetical protein OG413_41255 [Streptomyces sp. NBC_01433]|uniref:hypothetical protein n=1 Tax=Streptomyces sp. NBC_01433 TaxID=2903864 RepID=UPI002255C960|nr:hypothetical protein [Streptomyces sp. NBC_01433]MCX4681632.1 hypothetical protein [Streptomyces sp. NBC_01433]
MARIAAGRIAVEWIWLESIGMIEGCSPSSAVADHAPSPITPRRRSRPVADPEPMPATPVAVSPIVVDTEVVGRVGRLRVALRAAGFDVDEVSVPEPAFFDELRRGCSVELGAGELEAISSHVGGIPASYVLADAPDAELLRRIGAEGARMELRRDGFELHACQGSLPDDPDAMRTLSVYIREEMAIAVASIEAGETSSRRESPSS